MGQDYIPEQDNAAVGWMVNFADRLVAEPELYRTTPQDAADVALRVKAFAEAQARCYPIGDRKPAFVCTKNNARKFAEQIVRPEAQRIRKDPRIDRSLKSLLGLNVNTHRRRKIPVPTGVPVLSVKFNLAGVLTVRFLNSENFRTHRPAGAIGIELYERITPLKAVEEIIEKRRALPVEADAEEETIDPLDTTVAHPWCFVGVYTRSPIEMRPPIKDHGDDVAYIARWVTARGEPGAFGRGVSVRPAYNPVRDVGFNPQRNRRVA